jgi:superoxide dismutase, Fe-Mn family
MYNNRRAFIANSAKTLAAFSLSNSILSGFAASNNYQVIETVFKQEPLPYLLDSFSNVIDAQTMDIHYNKHAAAYCKNLNEAYKTELSNKQKTLPEILKKISKYSIKMRNNAGGHFNHEFFWKCLTPNQISIANTKIEKEIITSFGSYETFVTQFIDAAKSQFGSGWAWLVVNKNKQLQICSTPNQDNTLMDIATVKGTPILALDVWEHAYYLKYQNKRADYIKNWFTIINWQYVEQLFDAAKA